MAAIRNDRTTDGPALGTASTMVKKMPVPMVAPTPIMVRENRPMERLKPLLLRPSPYSTVVSIGLVRQSFWTRVWLTSIPL